jgi:hypothetical protein
VRSKANKTVGMIISLELCDGAHHRSSCPDQDIALGACIANANVSPGSGQRKRPLFFGYGHQRRTRSCCRHLQAGCDEEEHPPEDAEKFDFKAKETLHQSFAVRASRREVGRCIVKKSQTECGENRHELAERLEALIAESKRSIGVPMK